MYVCECLCWGGGVLMCVCARVHVCFVGLVILKIC